MTHHILTGAPGAGKTVILRGLERAGLAVVEEAATDVIAWEQARGCDEPWSQPGFIDAILRLQRFRERQAGEGLTIFDRSPVCTLALSRFQARADSPALTRAIDRLLDEGRYHPEVFFVEGLDFITPTAARRIDLDGARRFAEEHRRCYEALGFALIEIAPATPENRLKAVLRRLGVEAAVEPPEDL
ncbi:MAG: AAA family ATPase [Caulobacter sp.]|nr:AAA family ATPase [Caulobacter sp.]